MQMKIQINPTVTQKDKYTIDYFTAGPEKETDQEACARLIESIHNEFKDVYFRQ